MTTKQAQEYLILQLVNPYVMNKIGKKQTTKLLNKLESQYNACRKAGIHSGSVPSPTQTHVMAYLDGIWAGVDEAEPHGEWLKSL